MKVVEIQTYRAKRDQKLRWKVLFEEFGKERPLILDDEPTFSTGEDIPENTLALIQEATFSYYIPKEVAAKPRGRSLEDTNAIKAQVAVKIIADLFINDKLSELTESKNYLAIGLRDWLKSALVHDNTLVAEVLKKGAKTKKK